MPCRITLICSAPASSRDFPGDEPAAPRALARLRPMPARGGCVASPLRRAAQTAAALGLKARAEPALRELDYGRWAGRDIKAVLADAPAALAEWLADPRAAPHGGESLAAMAGRVAGWLEDQAAAGGSLIAITHPGPIQAALIHVLGAPLTSARRIAVRPASRMVLTHDGRQWSAMVGAQD